MFKARIKPLAFAIVLAGLGPMLLSAPVSAAADQKSAATIQEKVTVKPGKTINPQEEAVISSAGAKVLRHIAQARADIQNKDIEGAKTALGQAEKLLNIIQSSVPTTTINDQIWVAKKHLEYEDTREVLPDLIPIYTSLDELVNTMPVDTAKKHLDQAKEQIKAGDSGKARKALEATAAALQYTEIDLPLGTTRQLVSRAKTALDKENPEEAANALKSAEDSVLILSAAIEQPLFTAKALLWQTVLDLEAANMDLANADLKGAIGYLEIASHSDKKSTRDAAGQILAQARDLQKDLDSGVDIGTRVRRLWEHAQALAERDVEYLATGWSRYRAESPLKSDLIEARLHLANARIDLFTGHESGKARNELEYARQLLDQAGEEANKQQTENSNKEQIADFQKSLSELATDPASARESNYASLQQQLGSMIQSL
ncbi:MAG: YfdX family protein [Gammaproteobacteria bacterium]|jgi:hypothetical protein